MGTLYRLAQKLGLVYRDEGTLRPLGARRPPATPPAQDPGAARRLAQFLGLVYQDDGTARPFFVRRPPAASGARRHPGGPG
jgi:hypothetical protein